MSIRDKRDIKLLNYNTSSVNIPTPNGDKMMSGADRETGIPFADYFDWRDIEYAYNRSGAITLGLVEPDEEYKDEFYQELKMFDWKTKLWLHEDIVNVIENPTLEGMQRIVAIDNIIVLDRIRGLMVGYINEGRGIDSRFIEVVNHRWNELNNGIRRSKIIVKPIENSNIAAVNQQEIAAIKAQNELLMQQLAEMQKAIMGKTEAPAVETPKEDKPVAEPVKKSAGKPKAKNK